MDQITEYLYLGNVIAATNRYSLKARGVTHIITAAAGLRPSYPNDFKYLVFNLLDMPHANISQYFDKVHRFITEAKKNGGIILVHCMAGISRSSTCVIAYLMVEYGHSMK